MPTSFPSLSDEVRNTIYDLAIQEPDSLYINKCSHLSKQPAITRTTRQVRSEALPIWKAKCYSGPKQPHYHVHDFDFTTLIATFSGPDRANYLTNTPWKPAIALSLSREIDMSTAQARIEPWLRHRGTEEELKRFGNHSPAPDNYTYLTARHGIPPPWPKDLDTAFGRPSKHMCLNHGKAKLNRVQHLQWLGIRMPLDMSWVPVDPGF